MSTMERCEAKIARLPIPAQVEACARFFKVKAFEGSTAARAEAEFRLAGSVQSQQLANQKITVL